MCVCVCVCALHVVTEQYVCVCVCVEWRGRGLYQGFTPFTQPMVHLVAILQCSFCLGAWCHLCPPQPLQQNTAHTLTRATEHSPYLNPCNHNPCNSTQPIPSPLQPQPLQQNTAHTFTPTTTTPATEHSPYLDPYNHNPCNRTQPIP